jgi:hypothetical protein
MRIRSIANPRRVDASDHLAGALINLSTPRAEDERFMDFGLKLFPKDDWLRVSKAGSRGIGFAGVLAVDVGITGEQEQASVLGTSLQWPKVERARRS